MATITEDYVSFEVAKLLKEKGFLKGVDLRMTKNLSFYDGVGLIHNLNKYYDTLIQDKIDFVVAPTHQMAMKWLREVHKIYITISPVSGKGYGAILCDVGDFDDFNYIGETDYFFHPEEAVEAGIKYCLENLI